MKQAKFTPGKRVQFKYASGKRTGTVRLSKFDSMRQTWSYEVIWNPRMHESRIMLFEHEMQAWPQPHKKVG